MKVQKTSISYTALYLGLFYILFHGLGKGLDALAKGLDGDWSILHYIGLRHCAEFNYGNYATSVASFIIVIMTRAKRVL